MGSGLERVRVGVRVRVRVRMGVRLGVKMRVRGMDYNEGKGEVEAGGYGYG